MATVQTVLNFYLGKGIKQLNNKTILNFTIYKKKENSN